MIYWTLSSRRCASTSGLWNSLLVEGVSLSAPLRGGLINKLKIHGYFYDVFLWNLSQYVVNFIR